MTDVKRMRALKSSKPIKAFDVALIVIMAAGAIALALYGFFGAKKGLSVEIACGGEVKSYPLGENREVKLDSLTVVIEGGAAYVTDSKCPDRVCERTGRISREGQSIVCLPAGVVITVRGEGDIQLSTGQRS